MHINLLVTCGFILVIWAFKLYRFHQFYKNLLRSFACLILNILFINFFISRSTISVLFLEFSYEKNEWKSKFLWQKMTRADFKIKFALSTTQHSTEEFAENFLNFHAVFVWYQLWHLTEFSFQRDLWRIHLRKLQRKHLISLK